MVNKCVACQKSVYPLEAIVDGENWYHKGCFKCSQCSVRLDLRSFKVKNNAIWCVKCVPKEAHTSVADSVVMQSAKKGEALKKEVNLQKSNVITGERGTQSADTMAINEGKKASELNRTATTVKSNVITGERGTQSADTMAINEGKKASELNRQATTVKANVVTGERGTQSADTLQMNEAKRVAANADKVVKANVISGERGAQVADMATMNQAAAQKVASAPAVANVVTRN